MFPSGSEKYLYVRKRTAGKQTSTYVGIYTEELYNLLLRNAREAREIRKSLRSIEKRLAAAGYSEDELPADVITNIAFARANMKINIYDQAVLEGVATSFPQTEEILENGKVSGVRLFCSNPPQISGIFLLTGLIRKTADNLLIFL